MGRSQADENTVDARDVAQGEGGIQGAHRSRRQEIMAPAAANYQWRVQQVLATPWWVLEPVLEVPGEALERLSWP